MSRIAKDPVVIPAGVDVKFDGQLVTVKGSVGTLSMDLNPAVKINTTGTHRKIIDKIDVFKSFRK